MSQWFWLLQTHAVTHSAVVGLTGKLFERTGNHDTNRTNNTHTVGPTTTGGPKDLDQTRRIWICIWICKQIFSQFTTSTVLVGSCACVKCLCGAWGPDLDLTFTAKFSQFFHGLTTERPSSYSQKEVFGFGFAKSAGLL